MFCTTLIYSYIYFIGLNMSLKATYKLLATIYIPSVRV